jgi:hypothetical protein
MFKRIFFLGILSGIVAAIAAIIYNRIYFFATETDFSRILNTASIIGLNLGFCVLVCFLYWVLVYLLKKNGEIVFNFLFFILSFAMVIITISMSLPLDIKNPELFPGLAVPMVFFPALAWHTLRPLFKVNNI